jgi:hypothetical protein
VIECGSFEYAHARLHARHGQRADEAAWRRIEVIREFAPLLEVARTGALRPWLVGITADSSAHQVEAILRGHWRALVDERAAWMPLPWHGAVQWCAALPDLALLQHLARGGEPAAWVHDDATWRELCAAQPQARAAVLGAGPYAALAAAWSTPQSLGCAWYDEWQGRMPQPLGDAGDTLEPLVRVLLDHYHAFADADAGQGWLLRGALHARLSLLFRRAALEPAAAFIHLALCALDLERLRAELLRRLLFPRWQVA